MSYNKIFCAPNIKVIEVHNDEILCVSDEWMPVDDKGDGGFN